MNLNLVFYLVELSFIETGHLLSVVMGFIQFLPSFTEFCRFSFHHWVSDGFLWVSPGFIGLMTKFHRVSKGSPPRTEESGDKSVGVGAVRRTSSVVIDGRRFCFGFFGGRSLFFFCSLLFLLLLLLLGRRLLLLLWRLVAAAAAAAAD